MGAAGARRRGRARASARAVPPGGDDRLEGRAGAHGCGAGRAERGHGERSRLQLLLKLAGAEITLILAVNILAVNGALHALVSKSVLYTPYSVKKCLRHSM